MALAQDVTGEFGGVSLRKRIWGWFFFDWASQPYNTLLLTFIFGPYVKELLGDGSRAQAVWGYGVGIAGLVIAIFAPILGSVADRAGKRMPFVWLFSVFYVVGAWLLWYSEPGNFNLTLLMVAFGIGLVGMEFATIFTNAMLPGLGPREEIGRISGSGWAFGYVGGMLSLILMLVLFQIGDNGKTLAGLPPMFGLDPALREGTRIVGPLTAIWYAVFMIPFFLWVRERARPDAMSVAAAARGAVPDLIATLIRLKNTERSLTAYLVSSMFYRDALNGIYVFGGIYAVGVLGWSLTAVGIFGILGTITGAIFAWLGGKADDRWGPKSVIAFNVIVLTLVALAIVFVSRGSVLGFAVSPELETPRHRLLHPRRHHRRRRRRAAIGKPDDDGPTGPSRPDDRGFRPLCTGRQGQFVDRAAVDRPRHRPDRQPATRHHPAHRAFSDRTFPATLGETGRRPESRMIRILAVLVLGLATVSTASAEPTAKALFGAKPVPSAGRSLSIGSYAKGCMAGAVQLPETGPTWQAVRLSRNRNWGTPELVAFLERFSADVAKLPGWNGIYVGDLSQPRGGPMITGHASHQIGLDADIWMTPPPRLNLTAAEREKIGARNYQAAGGAYVNTDWDAAHMAFVRAAARDKAVARIFIFAGAKVQMCRDARGDRSWLRKVRPWWGHNDHIHVRLACPKGMRGCVDQAAPPPGDGCDEAATWVNGLLHPPKPDPNAPRPKPPRQLVLSDLPKQCANVLSAP